MDMLSRSGGLSVTEAQFACAPAPLSSPDEGIGHNSRGTQSRAADPTPFARQTTDGAHNSFASAPLSDEGELSGESRAEVLVRPETQMMTDLGIIVALWRQRQDLCRAKQRLDLQCQAVIRRYSDGDKAVAAKRWAAILKSADDPVAAILMPYQMAMEPLEGSIHALELNYARMVRKLPLWTEWGKEVRGLGEGSMAGLIGEAARSPGDYRSVSALWKRMGLAVIDGGRQRKVAGDAALEHGYAPQRRAFCYVLSTSLMKAQLRSVKDEDGKKAGESVAIGPYGELYLRRKAYELERGIPKAHAHNRAMRVMVKDLLKHCWVADRRATEQGSQAGNIGPERAP